MHEGIKKINNIKNDLIKFAKKQREIIRNYKSVPIGDPSAHSKLHRSNSEGDEDDLEINESGSKLLQILLYKFLNFEDIYYNERLVVLLGRSYIENQILSFIRKKKYIKNISHDLLQPKKHKWTIFVGVQNISLKKKINFKLGTLLPKGFKRHHLVNAKIKNEFYEFEKSSFIEINGIEAPSIYYAGMKAVEKAKSCFALIPNIYASFSYKEDVKFSGFIIGFNSTINDWCRTWDTVHKVHVLNEYQEAVIKCFGNAIKICSQRKSNIAKRILDITAMFYSAKSVLHPPAKLLLLVTVLESLLLEETFNKTAEYKRINRLSKNNRISPSGRAYIKIKKGVFFQQRLGKFVSQIYKTNNSNARKSLRFINELYSSRSEVTHLCKKHKLNDDQVKILEDISLFLIKKISESNKKTHLSALKNIGIVTGKI